MCVVCIVLLFFFFFSVTPRHRSHSAWIQLACKLYTYLCWNNWEFTLAHFGAPIMFYSLPARFSRESQLLVLNRKSVNSGNVDGSTKFTVRDEFPTNSFVSTWTPLPHVFIYHFFFVFLCNSSHEPPFKISVFYWSRWGRNSWHTFVSKLVYRNISISASSYELSLLNALTWILQI